MVERLILIGPYGRKTTISNPVSNSCAKRQTDLGCSGVKHPRDQVWPGLSRFLKVQLEQELCNFIQQLSAYSRISIGIYRFR
jgi:hypothetical protein